MKDITGYEGLYAITERGEVWSYSAKRFLKAGLQPNGYLRVILVKDRVKKNHYVHRLVAEAFLSNPNHLPAVNHKDECKTNNYSSNLEWCTHKYNANYGTGQERRIKKSSFGRKAIYCVELNKTFKSLSEAAKELNLSLGHLSKCCRGQGYYKSIHGYHFSFCEE